MSASFERGRLLAAQGRWDMAEKELRLAVAEDPDLPFAHSLLAVALLSLKRKEEALTEAQTAVHLRPDWSRSYYILSKVLFACDRDKDAEQIIRTAIQIEPDDADYHAALSSICFHQKRWAEALAAAEEGLKQDPDDIDCLNFRGLSLTKLGRRAEADHNQAETLARNPQDALSHTVQGWNYLESNRPKNALESFRTALQLDPDMDYAKQGMVEALKARNPVYRLMLMYFLWMARLRGGVQWAIILGFYFGNRMLNAAAQEHPALRPYVLPIIAVYLIFCVLTWVSQPAFNLLLRLNRFGRYALSPKQVVASNWFGGFLAAAIVFSLAGWLCGIDPVLYLGIWCGLMIAPVAMSLQVTKTKKRFTLCAASAVLGLIGLVAVFSADSDAVLPIQLFVWGWVLFPWLVNILA